MGFCVGLTLHSEGMSFLQYKVTVAVFSCCHCFLRTLSCLLLQQNPDWFYLSVTRTTWACQGCPGNEAVKWVSLCLAAWIGTFAYECERRKVGWILTVILNKCFLAVYLVSRWWSKVLQWKLWGLQESKSLGFCAAGFYWVDDFLLPGKWC